MLATRPLEPEALIRLLLTGLRVGVPIMALHGKSRVHLSLWSCCCYGLPPHKAEENDDEETY